MSPICLRDSQKKTEEQKDFMGGDLRFHMLFWKIYIPTYTM